MPEDINKEDEETIDILTKCMIHLEECKEIAIGQEVEIFIEDIMIYKGKTTEDNINKVKKYICDGCRYNIK